MPSDAAPEPTGPTGQPVLPVTPTPPCTRIAARKWNRLVSIEIQIDGDSKRDYRRKRVCLKPYKKFKRHVVHLIKTKCSGGTPATNRCLGKRMAAKRGWTGQQWRCLDTLWGVRESGWDHTNDNPTSDAYGIPQALPGSKMGPGWQYNPRVQIRWGLSYIRGRYGTPCAALAHSYANNWY